MNENYNPVLKSYSQKLRREMTKEEKHLWFDCLKQLPFTFKRQQIIGDYIVDFYCAKKSIVIELDGSQHYEQHGKEMDIERDSFMKSKGIKVLRYSNYDINKNFFAVCEDIRKNLGLIND